MPDATKDVRPNSVPVVWPGLAKLLADHHHPGKVREANEWLRESIIRELISTAMRKVKTC